jgi:hypothetical protein
MTPTAKRVRQLFDYDPATGALTWKACASKKAATLIGKRAGSVRGHGYRYVGVDGRDYGEHRIVWLWVHGEWPTKHIDHKNGDGTDNRIANLRLATVSQNHANAALQRNSPSGIKGVRQRYGRWYVRIAEQHIGTFRTKEEAAEAATRAAQQRWGDFANHGTKAGRSTRRAGNAA